jgi:tetratricopeptide (TPR) repeat protein
MSTEEPKTGNGASSDAKAEPGLTGSGSSGAPSPDLDAAVAWPPPEAAPGGDAPPTAGAADAPDASKATASNGRTAAGDSGVMTAPEPAAKPAAAKPADADAEIPAATPQEEMGLSNSTLHWLEDGDQAVPTRLTEPGTMPSYDPRAPVPGRRRAVLVVAGAGLVALIVAGYFYSQAEKRRAAQPAAAVVAEPARDLTNRAQAALAANRYDEALELAHLALVADQRFADAHFIVGSVQQARNQFAIAREEFRKYLELAPLGTHAQAARTALATMPP